MVAQEFYGKNLPRIERIQILFSSFFFPGTNAAVIIGGGVGAGVGTIVLLIVIITVTVTIYASTKGRNRNKKSKS